MRILLLGSGGREHAFAWKISQSPGCTKLYIAPGNAGTALCGENVPISYNDFPALGEFCLEKTIDMVVVGPEEPLVHGIWDYFKKNELLSNIPVIGPSREGAKLEGSKAFAKQFMFENGIPTAAYREFSKDNLKEGLHYLESHSLPIVLKADGLAAGKGVLILNDRAEAKAEFAAMLDGKFGLASEKVVVEQFLDGVEFSVFVITDGKNYKILPVAKDYKRVGEGDTGLNTGGMGAISPPPFVTDTLMQKVETKIIQPTIAGIAAKNLDYQGFIFFGLIKVGDEPFVIEYNCRMGDPEAEVVFPRLQNDLVELMEMAYAGKLDEVLTIEDNQVAATVFLVSGGYPGDYEKGKAISGLEQVEGSLVFHGGTKKSGDQLVTNGGRVLAVTSLATNLSEAVEMANRNAQVIDFQGKYYRKDIGFEFL